VTAAQAQTKVAHINSEKLLDTLPSRKKAIAEIDAINQKGLEELKEMNDRFEKEYYAYMNRKAGQTKEMNEYDEGRLTKMQQDIQNRQNEIDALLQKMSSDINERVLNTVKEAVKVVATKKGYNYVIDESSTLFANGPNITNEVIPELLRLDAEKSKAPTAPATNGTTPAPGR